MKSCNTYFKKKHLVIGLEIILGLACADLNAAPNADAESVEQTAQETSQQSTKKAKTAKKAEKSEELEAVQVEEDGRGKNLIGIAPSASQGEVSQKQFEYRPFSRNGELVEVVPGAIATQHSGSGKANQYFLRGFNLDHGTDFTTYVDGIPMNMTTHAHGQGYMDINSIIPELVKKVEYGKGPYYAEVGDFSAAGYAKMFSMDKLDKGIAKFTAGSFDYYRTLVANSNKLGDGDLLYAGEFNLYNGVWEVPEDSKKFNGQLRYTLDRGDWGMAINGKAYTNSWTATNQIPQAAIDSGAIGLYGSMDPTDGGESNRYSASASFWNQGGNWKNDANIYAVYTDLNLFSNFSGFTRGDGGDQILQTERRVQTGGHFEHTRYNKLFGFEMDNSIGLQFRNDQIMDLGLYETTARQIVNTVSKSNVGVTTVGTYFKNTTHWHDKVRTIAGLRGDFINNDVEVLASGSGTAETNAANSGSRGKAMISPKLSLVVGPWYNTEYFANIGYGYHSNDARGTTLQVHPVTGTEFDPDGNTVSPRIRPAAWSRGGEVGARTNIIPGLNSTFALWWLQSSEELVFVGDAGTTEVNGKSQRYGIEFTNYYKPTEWLTLDADYALTTAQFNKAPDGATNKYIPNSVGRVISAGALIEAPNGLFGTLRFRHFGSVPLDESGAVWAGDTNIANLGAGYKQKQYKFEVDIFNILGSQSNDIAYNYEYNYPNGVSGAGLMKHPVEPRMVRGTITVNF
ncbi:TonB-dependent receptor plug domain-containing protein [Methylomonas sp. OY6]|uniref:TonB-dependent receptor plug domain-containing protein n=1 Tax=Methylomonas defluvii TaxID=3045149 RepID=A0ABU4UL20_9GAMM|nr:TonB-dependent receptor plug domain-containing protein [Methylomonas sp. OY6]MDX8130176.1 TonB-dependent receptor plug domain-containing protein [Methylomonas sp. OY6]